MRGGLRHTMVALAAATLAPLLGLLPSTPLIDASVWDPHPVPPTPPYFEGWYLRATLLPEAQPGTTDQRQEQPDTLALLFAAAELPPPANGTAPLPAVYIALLHGDSQEGKTFVYEALPPLASVEVTTRGHNVTTPPDWRTPPEFTWRAEGGGGGLSAVVAGRHMVVRAEAGGGAARVWCEVEVGDWAYDGGVARPHSWTDVSSRARLHWYIHSLASSLTYLRLELAPSNSNSTASRVLEARRGLVHLEKNWGSRFPHAWLWAQGSVVPPSAHAGGATSFVISYGAVSPDPEGPFTHFGHFRDEALGLAWDFKPDDSFVSRTEVDSCAGVARLVIHGFDAPVTLTDGSTHRPRRRLALDFHRPAGTAACLLGPTGGGFERLCEETFHATARLTATLDGRLLREATFERVALELGAGLLCNGTCSGSGPVGNMWPSPSSASLPVR